MVAIANELADDARQHAFSDGQVEQTVRPLIALEQFSAGLPGQLIGGQPTVLGSQDGGRDGGRRRIQFTNTGISRWCPDERRPPSWPTRVGPPDVRISFLGRPRCHAKQFLTAHIPFFGGRPMGRELPLTRTGLMPRSRTEFEDEGGRSKNCGGSKAFTVGASRTCGTGWAMRSITSI